MEYSPAAWERANADAGCDSSSNKRRDFLVRGGGHSPDDAAESAALARAV